MNSRALCRLSPVTVIFIGALISALSLSACVSSEESVEDPLYSKTARLQYQVDSLMAENQRMSQEVGALASENRTLTARAAELEMKLKDAMAAPPPPPPPADHSAGYAGALAQYRARDFGGAMQQFESLLSQGIRDDLADNCHYWIGECLYGTGKYNDAIPHFERAMGYAQSEKKDDSQLMIGNSYAAMGNKDAAREAYQKVISSFPASPYVQKAQEKLGRLG